MDSSYRNAEADGSGVGDGRMRGLILCEKSEEIESKDYTRHQNECALSLRYGEAPLTRDILMPVLPVTSQPSSKDTFRGAVHVLAALRSVKPKGVNVQSRCEWCRRWCSNYCRGCMEESGLCTPLCSTELRDCYVEYHRSKAAVWLGGGDTTVRNPPSLISDKGLINYLFIIAFAISAEDPPQ